MHCLTLFCFFFLEKQDKNFVPSTSQSQRKRKSVNYDENSVHYDFESEKEGTDFSANESDYYDDKESREPMRRKSLRGIMAYQAMVKQKGGLVGNKAPIEVRGRGRGIRALSTRGRGHLPGRGRGRGLLIQRIEDHSRIVDELIEEDEIYQPLQRHVKVIKSPSPILSAGNYFNYFPSQ